MGQAGASSGKSVPFIVSRAKTNVALTDVVLTFVELCVFNYFLIGKEHNGVSLGSAVLCFVINEAPGLGRVTRVWLWFCRYGKANQPQVSRLVAATGDLFHAGHAIWSRGMTTSL